MTQPNWITQQITPYDLAAILQSGCASGAYMPAVTYHQALETMSEHGNDILNYLEEAYGGLPTVPDDSSWAGMAVFYLSDAIELWCAEREDQGDWEDDNSAVT